MVAEPISFSFCVLAKVKYFCRLICIVFSQAQPYIISTHVIFLTQTLYCGASHSEGYYRICCHVRIPGTLCPHSTICLTMKWLTANLSGSGAWSRWDIYDIFNARFKRGRRQLSQSSKWHQNVIYQNLN